MGLLGLEADSNLQGCGVGVGWRRGAGQELGRGKVYVGLLGMEADSNLQG